MDLKKIAKRIIISDNLCLTNSFCNVDMGLSRDRMPQIKQDDLPEFLNQLEMNGIEVLRNQKVFLDKLKLIQNEIDSDKVNNLMRQGIQKLNEKPILVSSDLKIIDGNHRFAALYFLDKEATIPCHIINLPIKDVFKIIFQFNNVFKKDLKDSKVARIINKIINKG